MEILINTPIIAERILKGDFHEIKAIMAKSRELGMRPSIGPCSNSTTTATSRMTRRSAMRTRRTSCV